MYANAKIASWRNMFLKRPRVSRNNTLISHSSCKPAWQPHRSTSSRFFRSRDLARVSLALFDMAENNGAKCNNWVLPYLKLTTVVRKLNSPWHVPILIRMQIPRTTVESHSRVPLDELAISAICDARGSKFSSWLNKYAQYDFISELSTLLLSNN